jgi:hypothetical protein
MSVASSSATASGSTSASITLLRAPPSLHPPSLSRMAPITDSDLYARGAATLLASWEEYAGGSSRAALLHRNGVAAAVFPR